MLDFFNKQSYIYEYRTGTLFVPVKETEKFIKKTQKNENTSLYIYIKIV